MTTEEKIAQDYLGHCGRMISGSKSIYSYDNPDHLVVFNANVIIHSSRKKIWHGDLDLSLDYKKLLDLSKRLNSKICVLWEMDARFEFENSPKIGNAVASFHENAITLGKPEYHYLDKANVPKTLTTKEFKKKFKPIKPPKIKYKETDYEKIKLPKLSSLKPKKGYSFLEKFEAWFIKKYGLEKAQEIYPRLYVTAKYYRQLENSQKKAILVAYSFMHPVKVRQSLAWAMLNAPSSFQNKPKWAEDSHGYIKITNGENKNES